LVVGAAGGAVCLAASLARIWPIGPNNCEEYNSSDNQEGNDSVDKDSVVDGNGTSCFGGS